MSNAYSWERLRGFNLAQLPRDAKGLPDGADYQTFLRLNEMRAGRNLRAGVNGIWSGSFHALAAGAEANAFVVLEGNPHAVSIREGYPFLSAAVLAAAREGREIHRDEVMTIDFLLTLPPFNFRGPLRYLGLSRKEEYLKSGAAGRRRAQKEAEALAQVGWAWDYLAPPSQQDVDNHHLLRSWAKVPDDGAIDIASAAASNLAALIYRTTSRKELGSLLGMLGRRLHIPEVQQYFVFAVAYYLGYVALEPGTKLGERRPLQLAQPTRRFGRPYERG